MDYLDKRDELLDKLYRIERLIQRLENRDKSQYWHNDCMGYMLESRYDIQAEIRELDEQFMNRRTEDFSCPEEASYWGV